MTKTEFNSLIKDIDINSMLIDLLEKKYGKINCEMVKKILSYNKNKKFINKLRVISKEELLYSEETLGVDFVKYKIIPIFDRGDNDYICYDLQKNNWTMFNIVDEIKFVSQNNLLDYLPD